MKRFGKMCLLIQSLSNTPTFKSFILSNDYTVRFRKIIHAIDDELSTNIGFKNISQEKVQILEHLKVTILKITKICCDQSIGLNVPGTNNTYQNNSQLKELESIKDQTLILENIPQISQIQDILRSLSASLTLPKAFLTLYGISESEDQGSRIEEETREDWHHQLSALKEALKMIRNLSENTFGQIIILYTEYSKIVSSKPNTIISFYDIFYQLTQILAKNDPDLLPQDSLAIDILYHMLTSLYWLCHNPASYSFLPSDKRKAAVRSLLLDKKMTKDPKGGATKPNQPVSTSLAESLEKLQVLVHNKAQSLVEFSVIHTNKDKRLTKSIQYLQKSDFIVRSLIRYTNLNIEAKKEMDKNPELPIPRDLEQRFKEIEEKDTTKIVRKELAKHSSNSNVALGIWYSKQVLADVLLKLNTPYTPIKRARILNIAHDQIGFIEPTPLSYSLSRSNNYEVHEWDFDSKVNVTNKHALITAKLNEKQYSDSNRIDLQPNKSLHDKKRVIQGSIDEYLKCIVKELQVPIKRAFFYDYEAFEITGQSKIETKFDEKAIVLMSNITS